MTTKRRNWGLAAVTIGGAALALGAAGCNYIGPIGYMVAGPDDIPAAYKLPENKTAVIFIDDRASHIASRQTRAMIAETAEQELLTNGAVKDMVSGRNAMQAALRERYGKPMTIVEIGKAVDAKTVIYVTMDQFTLSTDNTTFSPGASMRVKVIDVETEKRLFPGPDAPTEYYAISVPAPQQTGEPPKNAADTLMAEQNLAKWTGRTLARAFFDHPPPMGESKKLDTKK